MLALPLPAVVDGAMATELERRGAGIDGSLWSARALFESGVPFRVPDLTT